MHSRSKFHCLGFNEQAKFGEKEDCVYKFATGLTESQALELESKLIYFYGPSNSIDRPLNGKRLGCLLNNRYEKAPAEFVLSLKEFSRKFVGGNK